MANDYFSFKRFTVWQRRAAMRVGTDGVLLGAWFDPGGDGARMLDVGTGTGVIALMAAQRNPSARIDAVEIDAGSCADAAENFAGSPWAERLALFGESFVSFCGHATRKYDRIVSNPPYFVGSLKCPDPGRTRARHTDSLPHPELLAGAAGLLTEKGCLSVVLPADGADAFTGQAARYGLFPARTLAVCPVPGTVPKRMLIEFRTFRGASKRKCWRLRRKAERVIRTGTGR